MISTLLVILLTLLPQPSDTTSGRVWLSAALESGEYRNVYDSKTLSTNRIGAEGTASRGAFRIRGRFEYGYDYGTGSTWRGWIDPYRTPFMVCDSIPGNISLETYDMSSELQYALGKWRLGTSVSYRTSLMAKHKDLRNKNVLMDFSIAPSLAFVSGSFSASLSLAYDRNTEQVEYMQVDESTEKYLFQTYGMWFYTGSGFNSAENRRFLAENGTSAALSFSWKPGKFLMDNRFSASYRMASQSETGYNNLSHGDSRTLEYADRLKLAYGVHSLRADFSFSQLSGARALQRQELDPASKIRRWFTYGEASDIFWREVLGLGAAYSFSAPVWGLEAGADYLGAVQSYKEFPALFSQDLRFLTSHLSFSWTPSFGLYGLALTPSLAWKHRLGGERFRSELFAPVGMQDELRQLPLPFDAEYDYWSADYFQGGLSASLSRSLRSGGSLRFGLGYSLRFASSARHFANISVEYLF